MSSETPKGPPADRLTEPFTRGKITWGRPPQAVFQVGPLPRATAAPLVTPPPARATGASILSGSMVPPAKPASAPVPQPEFDGPEFEPVVEPEVVAPSPEPEPLVLEPEPVAAAPEIVVEPETPEPAVTVPPPLSSEARPAAEPRKLPSVVVTPAIYATVGAAIEKVTKKDRWLVVAAVAAIVVTGGFIWLATLPAPQPVDDAAGPALVAEAPLVEQTPPVEAPTPARTAPAETASASAAPATAAPAPTAPARPAQTRPAPAAPIVVTPPVEAAPQPSIEIAPLVVEPPTPAEPAPTNPDAPVSTAPQPLN